MSQTAIAVQTPFGPYGSVSALGLDLTFTAADASNGNSFLLTGGEILLIYNSDSSSHTFTISSVADALGRSGDVTTYAVAGGVISCYSFRGGVAGWQQSDGTVHLAVSSALIKFAIIKPKS